MKDRIDFMTDGNTGDKKLFESLIKGEKQSSAKSIELLVKFFKK